MSQEDLVVWESFSLRFSRVIDLYVTKYLKVYVLLGDPAFEGSFRDLLDTAEKMKIISSTDLFMKMREIRNLYNHDYREDKLVLFLTDLQIYSPELLKIKI